MFHKLVHTLGSRLIMAIFNVLLLFITTRWMGAEVKGEISLLILNLGIVTLISGLFGGPALVYLVPRHALRQILILNYGWTLVASAAFTLFLVYGKLAISLEAWRFFRMALTEGLIAANLMIFLGAERVTWHNTLQVLKAAATVALLILFINYRSHSFVQFVNAYEISLVFTLLCSTVLLWRMKTRHEGAAGDMLKTLRESLKFGSLVQVGNFAQLLNYRLSYYFLELLISPPQLALIRIGVYSAAVQVSEALWQFVRSVSTVQYSVVSNLGDRAQGLQLSLRLARLNYAVTFIGVLFLFFIPASGYGRLFGPEFSEIRKHFIIMSPGIVAMAFSGAFSHFFAGVGDHRLNTLTSVSGLVLTFCLLYPSINYFSTVGAAAVSSVVYIFQASLQYYFLTRKDEVRLHRLILTREDLATFITGLKRLMGRGS